MRLSIPTPTTSAVEIGPLTIHFYALCIIAGVALAIWLGNRRFTRSHEGLEGVVADVAKVGSSPSSLGPSPSTTVVACVASVASGACVVAGVGLSPCAT